MVEKATKTTGPTPAEVDAQIRQLALVDRVLGLEAEVARLSAITPSASGARDEVSRLESELRAVYASRTWRIGNIVLRPFRALTRGPR